MIGDKYAEALGNGLQHSYANKVNVASNRLNPKGAIKIIEGLNYNVREIDFSDNRVGEKNQCIQRLVSKTISDRNFKLEVLILDSNMINDEQIGLLIEGLLETGNPHLRVLSLASNLITDASMNIVSELLTLSISKLRELRLNWNKITAKGGLILADAIADNKYLKVLNLSWNNLGSIGKNHIKSGHLGKAWGEALQLNKTLAHLDLSYNKFSQIEVENMSDFLADNHTLYGIHFEGNQGRIDSLGFLNIK